MRAVTRWVWERVPPVENLSPGYRKVIGFWQHVVEKRVNLTLKTDVTTTSRAPSLIVYTPSGHVLGGVSPQGPTTLKRFFDLAPSGDEVNLRFPITRNPQGEEMTTLVTMKRLSGERDMLDQASRTRDQGPK